MSAEVPSDCDYDGWGADFGAQTGARCLNSDSAHQAAYHGGPETDDGEPVRMPWRFDVPEVPAHVTALLGGRGVVWLREARPEERGDSVGSFWSTPSLPGVYHISEITSHLPLVECPDPRATT